MSTSLIFARRQDGDPHYGQGIYYTQNLWFWVRRNRSSSQEWEIGPTAKMPHSLLCSFLESGLSQIRFHRRKDAVDAIETFVQMEEDTCLV